MRFAFYFFLALVVVAFSCPNLAAQKKTRVETFSSLAAENSLNDCKVFKAGKAVAFPKPAYPAEAKAAGTGGTVQIKVRIDEKGTAGEIESIWGHKLLQSAAANAARKTKFSPTVCDGAAKQVSAVLIYNFILLIPTGKYFTPTKIEDFADIRSDSPYYETILNLAGNYRLAFGYDDRKFYGDAPLTRGDFAQFLRLTLDLLAERARTAGKSPREINLFNPYNPQKISAASGIKDFKPKDAFADSVKILLLTYDIAPVNQQKEFQGKLPLTNNEVIDIWSKIFGTDAIPVNFEQTAESGDRIISRGEFALFLQESLQVLTYKVMP